MNTQPMGKDFSLEPLKQEVYDGGKKLKVDLALIMNRYIHALKYIHYQQLSVFVISRDE